MEIKSGSAHLGKYFSTLGPFSSSIKCGDICMCFFRLLWRLRYTVWQRHLGKRLAPRISIHKTSSLSSRLPFCHRGRQEWCHLWSVCGYTDAHHTQMCITHRCTITPASPKGLLTPTLPMIPPQPGISSSWEHTCTKLGASSQLTAMDFRTPLPKSHSCPSARQQR
jgi:hypothetical protein